MEMQHTIATMVEIKGIGLHCGKDVTIRFLPAPPNTGVIFRRIDIDGQPEINAHIANVEETARKTQISKGDIKIYTVEHVLAALAGLKIDNVIIEIDSNEPPAGDGSAKYFFDLLEKAKITRQNAIRKVYFIKSEISIEEKDLSIKIKPFDGLKITYYLEYNHPSIGEQKYEFIFSTKNFRDEIMKARTFGFKEEVEKLYSQGLGLGGSLDNAIVLDKDGIMNEEGLRYQDEFVRHKILDLLGDLYLAGRELRGEIIAKKTGHTFNIKLVRKIIEEMNINNKGVYDMIDINGIMEILPHRYPFLMVDRILDIEEGKKAIGLKNVSINENFFNGHFPKHPVMPGVLILEALAQVCGVFMLNQEKFKGKLPYFVGVDKVRFRKSVYPGDQLKLEVEILKVKGTTGKVFGKATVNNELVASGELMFTLVNA